MEQPPLNAGDGRTSLLHAHVRAGPFLATIKSYRGGFTRGRHEHSVGAVDFFLTGLGRTAYAAGVEDHAPGDVKFCPAGLSHTHQLAARELRCVHLSFLPGLHGLPAEADVRLPESPVVARSPACVGMGLRLLRALRDQDASTALEVESIAYEALSTMADTGRRTLRSERIESALDLLHASIDRPVALAELAQASGLHRGRFSAVFKGAMGCSPGQYHRGLRLMEAVRLLMGTDEPVSSVAARTGFADQAHLTRAVTKACGVPPARLRRSVRGPMLN